MCDCSKKVTKLEQELEASHQREADLFKTVAEAKNFQSQTTLRPYQIIVIPIVVAFVGMFSSLIVAILK